MEQKVTIYTLAEKLNMSVSAVSRAFNPNSKLSAEKRKIILEAAEQYGYVQNKMASRLSQQPIRIGVLMRGRIEAYYLKMLDGIKAAYADFQNYKVTCDIRTLSRDDFSADNACAVLEEFRSAGYDGVILHGIYHEGIVAKVNELAEAGIKVVTLHNDLPASSRLFTSTTNTEYTGRMVAQLFDIFLPPDRRNIIAFSGSMQSLIHQGLIFSFSRCAMTLGLQLLQHYDTLDTPQIAERLVQEAFETHERIDAIYISSSNSIPICRYVDEHGLSDQVTIIASDIFDELNEYLRRGVVNATIFQDPFAQGYAAFEKLYYNLAENRPVPTFVTARPQIVLKSNLPLYQKISCFFLSVAPNFQKFGATDCILSGAYAIVRYTRKKGRRLFFMLHRVWESRMEPFRVFGNLYFVGTEPASAHLIDTGAGLILLDSGYPETLYLVLDSIRRLGFRLEDLALILHSHGHIDHIGGTRALVELTGAKTAIGAADADTVRGRRPLTFAKELGMTFDGFFSSRTGCCRTEM